MIPNLILLVALELPAVAGSYDAMDVASLLTRKDPIQDSVKTERSWCAHRLGHAMASACMIGMQGTSLHANHAC